MSKELAQLPNEIVSSIILHNDLSKLTKDQQVQYVAYRCQKAGLDVAGSPFNLIPNKEGKLFLYANKEAAAQLNQLRHLSPKVSKEEFLLDNSVYKVTYSVTEDGRTTEDCGAVGLVKVKKMPGKEDEVRRLSADEVADAIMKAHTKAKRRAILTHCGIGTNDLDEPLIVVDQAPGKEEIKDADAKVKEPPKPEAPAPGPVGEEKPAPAPEQPTPPKGKQTWTGKIDRVDLLESNGHDVWALHGDDGTEFKTAEKKVVKDGIEKDVAYEVTYEVNGRGTRIALKLKEKKA